MQMKNIWCIYVPTLLIYEQGIKLVFFSFLNVSGGHDQKTRPVTGIFILSTAFMYNQPFSVNHVEYLFSGSEVD